MVLLADAILIPCRQPLPPTYIRKGGVVEESTETSNRKKTRCSVEHRTRTLMGLAKWTNWMKHEVFILGKTIGQKARRDGREARGNEEREKRED